MRDATRLLMLVGALAVAGMIAAICASTVRAGTPAAGASLEGVAADASHDDGSPSATPTNTADPGRRNRPCFPVSMPVWAAGFHADDYVTGWASVDQTARFEGRSCEIKGWAPDPCGRMIPVYRASCPDGAFTFTKTEADCYNVL